MTTNRYYIDEDETKKLITAITDFFQDQVTTRIDFTQEDRKFLKIAIECLELAYDVETNRSTQNRFPRPLLDIFKQVMNPVRVKDKIQADAHKEKGNNFGRRKLFADAEIEYTRAIQLNKWNSIYFCNRACVRIEERRYFDAIIDCRRAIMLNPDYAKAYTRMGQAYTMTPLIDRRSKVIECFRKALELDPENLRYRHNLTVAENQANGSDATQIISNVLTLLFPSGSDRSEYNNPRIFPTSLVIVTDVLSRSLVSGTSTQTDRSTESSQISFNTSVTKSTQVNPSTTFNKVNNITPSESCDNVDKRKKEQAVHKSKQLSKNEGHENSANPEKVERCLSLPTFNFDIVPAVQPQFSQTDNCLQNAEINKKLGKVLQNNVSGKKILTQDESRAESSKLTNVNSNKKILRKSRDLSSTAEQSFINARKKSTRVSTDFIKEGIRSGEKKTAKKRKSGLFTVKDSLINVFNRQRKETEKNRDENIVNGNGILRTEKSQDNSKHATFSGPQYFNTNSDYDKAENG